MQADYHILFVSIGINYCLSLGISMSINTYIYYLLNVCLYSERARYWLPCVDFPSARPTLSFSITADETLNVVCNGEFIEQTAAGLSPKEGGGDGLATAHWKLDFPCPSYLTCLGVGDFVSVSGRCTLLS